jgi:hypothetical protein
MTVPGVGREHQAGLDELARSFVQGRDGMALSAAWDQRVEREAKEAERQRAQAEERERRDCRRSRIMSGSGRRVDWISEGKSRGWPSSLWWS